MERIERVRDIICRSRLWFNSPANFNDPFDFKWIYTIDKNPTVRRNRIRIILEQNPAWSDKSRKAVENEITRILSVKGGIEPWIHAAREKHAHQTGVCCFSEQPRDILMWSHYAKNHTGLAFQFDVNQEKLFLEASRVNYSDEYPIVEWTENHESGLKAALYRKFKVWEYEKELRIIRPMAANSYVSFNAKALSGIILGCRFDNLKFFEIEELVAERRSLGLPEIRIYKVEQKVASYEVAIRNIKN